jgi:hypothetical protein
LKDLSALPTLKEFQELEAGEDVMEEVLPGADTGTGTGPGAPASEAEILAEEAAYLGEAPEESTPAEEETEPATAAATEESNRE